ncbi:MAG: hypothetical protein AAFX93_02915 [Verrucomicrobiota bacterium]
MTDDEQQLLMRHFDGEATTDEEVAVARLLDESSEAQGLLDQWRQQRDGFKGVPRELSEVEVESDWRRLQAQLLTDDQTLEDDNEGAVAKPFSTPAWIWSAAAAIIALAAVVFLLPRSPIDPPGSQYPVGANIVETVETDLEGVSPIVFVDAQTGWSVVWVDEAPSG